MSVTMINEVFNRPVSDTLESMEATRVFKLQTTARESGVLVLQNTDIPALNSTHPDNSSLICKSRSANPIGEGDVWEVTCSYSPSDFSYTPEPRDDKPWELPPYNISYGAVSNNRVLVKGYEITDSQGNPTEAVLNSAGDPFDPPAEKVSYNTLLKFSYNKRHFTLEQVRLNQGTTNKTPITVLDEPIATESGRINQISARKLDVKDSDGDFQYSYYQIDVEIEISQLTFFTRLLDSGFYYINGSDKKEIMKSDIDSTITAGGGDDGAVTEPQKLDGAGGLLTTGEPVYLPFRAHFPKDWNGLELPKTMNG